MKAPSVQLPLRLPDTMLLETKQRGRAMWLLQRMFLVIINGRSFKIPAGFEFDFASVPRMLWPIVPPIDPKYAAASLLHDMAYAAMLWPRKYCDQLFLAAMKESGAPKWKRSLMYIAVRIGGAIPYAWNKKKIMPKVRKLMNIESRDIPAWPAGYLPEE